jgi:hypothetical protein
MELTLNSVVSESGTSYNFVHLKRILISNEFCQRGRMALVTLRKGLSDESEIRR